MALRSSTMTMPYSDQTREPQPEQYNLPRKLAIVLLLVIASSLWLFILFREKRLQYPTSVQEIAAGAIVAIVAGVLGFAGIATAMAGIAKLLFIIFLVLFLVSLLMGLSSRRPLV